MPPARSRRTIDGWRAREPRPTGFTPAARRASAGYPFRFELNCTMLRRWFKSSQPPLEIKSRGVLVAAQVYEPTLLISGIPRPR